MKDFKILLKNLKKILKNIFILNVLCLEAEKSDINEYLKH
jgi:hypothetical protein